MDSLLISGGRALHGRVRISGAKNAALPLACASLLSDQPLRLTNLPDLRDVVTLLDLLVQMGVTIDRSAGGEVTLDGARITRPFADYEMVKTMRASILVLGPLLARCGQARVSLPGGCAIGQRPVDLPGLEEVLVHLALAKVLGRDHIIGVDQPSRALAHHRF